MKFDQRRLSAVSFIVLLVSLNIFANFYLRAKIRIYGDIRLCYEKLAVAYDIGGKDGLTREFSKMRSETKGRLAKEFLKNVDKNLREAKDPELFLHKAVAQEKQEIDNSRTVVIILNLFIVILFALRILINIRSSGKIVKSP